MKSVYFDPKTDIIEHGSSKIFNNWSEATRHYHKTMKAEGLTGSDMLVTAYYLADSDDPYATNLDGNPLFDDINQGSAVKWTIKSIGPNAMGDLGNIKDLDSDRQGYRLSGMQNAVIIVTRKSLVRNTNGQLMYRQTSPEPIPPDQLASLLVHMPSKGLNLMPAGERKMYIPLPHNNRMVMDPFHGTNKQGDRGINVWRETEILYMGKEMLAKTFLQNMYGLDTDVLKNDKSINKLLADRYAIPLPSVRRIKTEYIRTVELFAQGESRRLAIARTARTKRNRRQ